MKTSELPLSAKRLLCALAIWLIAGVLWAQESALPYYNAQRVTNLKYGIVCYGEPASKVPAPDTINGFINERPTDGSFIVETLTIPVIRGVSFGVRVDVLGGQPLAGVTMTVTHPAQTDANITTESWLSDFGTGGSNGGSFTFEFDYEETPGPWIMEASHGGDLLYRVKFDLIDPNLLDKIPKLCEGEPLLG